MTFRTPTHSSFMDRTVLYREIVRIALEGEPEPVKPSAVEPDAVTVEVNSIASSLARLQASLKHMRPRYLAMSGFQQMRDSEKDDFDYLVRQMLQNEQRRVRALEQREQTRYASSKPKGFASRWLSNPESEGLNDTLAKHRQGMFFYLNSLLQKVSINLGELQQVRSARSAVVKPVAHSTGQNFTQPQSASMDAESVPLVEPISTSHHSEPPKFTSESHPLASQQGQQQQEQQQEQQPGPQDPSLNDIPESHMQLLLEEHDTLLEDLNANLEKAQRAEQSLREVADLQSELSQHLSSQSQQLESLTTDVFRTTTDVSGANEQLEKAKRSNRRASRFVIVSSVATGVFLLLLNGR